MAGGAHHKLLGLHLQTPTLLADSDHIRFWCRRKSPAEKEYDEETHPTYYFLSCKKIVSIHFSQKATEKHLAIASGSCLMTGSNEEFLFNWKKRQTTFGILLPRLLQGNFEVWQTCIFKGEFIGLAYQGKDIVFRFIIEYSSLMDFGPS
jgi:hypothetical protein